MRYNLTNKAHYVTFREELYSHVTKAETTIAK